ncbi:MAG: outer membrane lipoprotein carrier protein LolA [Bdellovibrionales bacterium]|nr:outer membrane lipoprotein carrier protein LolA [Bdellovibrionales bacterium]
MLKLLFCICLLFQTFAFSLSKDSEKPKSNKDVPIHKILSDYQRRESVTMEVTKTLTQPVLKRETQSQGTFYFANQLWRFEVTSPHPSVIFYDGKRVTYFANNVSHHTPSGQEMILSTLLDPEAFYKKFTYQGVHQKGRTQIYSFRGNPPAPQKLSIQVERDRILSLRIHWDSDLGEEFYRFRSIRFDQKLDKKLFQEP